MIFCQAFMLENGLRWHFLNFNAGIFNWLTRMEAKELAHSRDCAAVDTDLASEKDKQYLKQKLQDLLKELSDRFDEDDCTYSNMPPVGVKIKDMCKDQIFYRLESKKSPKGPTSIQY